MARVKVAAAARPEGWRTQLGDMTVSYLITAIREIINASGREREGERGRERVRERGSHISVG